MMPDGTVVIGAGLAGVSAAYHIGKGCELFEAGYKAGGLLGTRWIGGYGFDYTGHLLHLKDPYVRGLVKGLLKDNLAEHERNAAIYTEGVFTRYPYQANTYGLPEKRKAECMEGFLSAPGRDPSIPAPGNFRDWITHNFGRGIAQQFMLPYNQKLWRYALEGMTVDGIAPYVPVPTVEEVERGAGEGGAVGLGYNAKFFYPKRGGIYALVEAMLPGVRDLSLGQRAVEVDADRRTVTFETGYTAFYDRLVSTIPLPELVRMIKDVPAGIREAAAKLRYVSVYDISLGVRRAGLCPYHWIYFPGGEFPFYRAGFLTNFSEGMAPAGCSSIYVELSHEPETGIPEGELFDAAEDGLRRCGLLRPEDEVEVRDASDIKYAYVVFDRHRKVSLPAIMEYLGSKGIMSIGRYGAWEYSSMEDAIIQGRDAAKACAG